MSEVPAVQVVTLAKRSHAAGSVAPEALLRITLPGVERLLVVESGTTGQPRHARAATNQLLRYQQEFPTAYPVFVAPYVSPAGAAICRAANVGYVDLAGNGRLCFDNVCILREGRPNPLPQRREQRSLFSPRATRVLRACLLEPRRPWRLTDLAVQAGVSLGHAVNVTRCLADREWLRRTSDGLRLTNAEALLEAWADQHSLRRSSITAYHSAGDTGATEAALVEACAASGVRYALTGLAAAARRATGVSCQHVSAYIDGDPDPVVQALALERVRSGANVLLLRPYDVGVFQGSTTIGGAVVVSVVQAYLDLIGHPGCSAEAAQILLEQALRPTW
jgi:hypothetical protein